MNLNKVQLIGRVGRDPEVHTFPSGDRTVKASLATSEYFRDRQNGETKEVTEWHNLVFKGKAAEFAADRLAKGLEIYVEGRLRTRKWTDQAGATRYMTEVHVDQMQPASSPQGGKPHHQHDDSQGSSNWQPEGGDPNLHERAMF